MKELRKSRNWLQKDVAEKINCSTTVYCRYETGSREPSNEVLVALASLYGVSVDYILGRDTEESTDEEVPDSIDQQLKGAFAKLSDEQKERILDYIEYEIARQKHKHN